MHLMLLRRWCIVQMLLTLQFTLLRTFALDDLTMKYFSFKCTALHDCIYPTFVMSLVNEYDRIYFYLSES